MRTALNYTFISSVCLSLISCGGAGKSKDGMSAYSINAQLATVQNISAEERAIATRICYAYKSKGSTFRTPGYIGASFTFNVKNNSCEEGKSNYIISSILKARDANSLYFASDSNDKVFVEDVQTDKYGFLAKLCTKIQNNQAISNTAVENSSKIQVRFFKTAVDAYTLSTFTLSGNVVKIAQAETFQVRTQFNLGSGQILGMDELYTRQATCAFSPDKYSELTQQFTLFTNK